jgi:outer membrane protein assembly factor BamB
MSRLIVVGVSLVVLITAGPVRAQLKAGPGDWPGWRGADRTGVSPETGLLKEWPEGGPKLLWKATGLGEGYSTPSVAGGRIYSMGSKGGAEYAMALDANGGKPLWETKIGAVAKDGPPSYPGPRCTPTVDGDRVYVLGSDGDLACLDLGGKVIWQKNLEKDLGGKRGIWAYSESPLIDGDVLVCTPGDATATLAALNKKTGAVIWTAQVPEGGVAAYASVIIAEAGGVKQYVQFLNNGAVGVAAKDGKLLWNYRKIATRTSGSTAIPHDGTVFVSASGPPTAGGPGAALLRPKADGGVEEVYVGKTLANHHGGIVKVGDFLYGTNQNALVCQDFKTGATKWESRLTGKGSVSAADGHLYVRGEKSGHVFLVEATPDSYKPKGRLEQPDRSQTMAWPHPVIANGRLYLRDQDVLLCYDLKAK